MAARIVADIISKEKTTQEVSFAEEQVDTMEDVSILVRKQKTLVRDGD